ncbi:dicarboxylate/amino acid:cation symporter [Kordiimonas lipolytica]|uniref:Dicarboxylate/amino acid:cation symporter n=1 Tax=Kordiimonas lipolytica TaxID=1662421 RepID=A0ABV8UC17_9PROT|nr:dicarboxylate/amino acid:cation symporter [Kordiimonas lipolytica]
MAGEQQAHQPVEMLHPRSLKYLSRYLRILVRGRLWLQVVIGMIAGLVLGYGLGPTAGLVPADISATIVSWVALPGHLFLALIQMIVIPLIFASVIRGLAASENMEQLRSLGMRIVPYFICTTAIAITIGLVAAMVIQPGHYVDAETVRATLGGLPQVSAPVSAEIIGIGDIPEKILGILPTNPLVAMTDMDMLKVVLFAVIVGVALVLMEPVQAKPLLDLLGSLQAVCMTVVRWAMLLAPFAVFGLMTQLTSKIGFDALFGMAVYVLTVLAGLGVLFLFYMTVVTLVARRNPIEFVGQIRELLLLAFSTSSSAAVMPLSIRTAEDKLDVRPSISQFIVPIGATINMDGTALYQGVAAVFLAQVFGVDIGLSGYLLIVLTSVGASIGTPATPGVGIVILSMVVTSVGIPVEGIVLIMGVDRILDMCRTMLNVTGDMVASTVMDRWVGGARPLQMELAAEARRESIRRETGEDIIITKH